MTMQLRHKVHDRGSSIAQIFLRFEDFKRLAQIALDGRVPQDYSFLRGVIEIIHPTPERPRISSREGYVFIEGWGAFPWAPRGEWPPGSTKWYT